MCCPLPNSLTGKRTDTRQVGCTLVTSNPERDCSLVSQGRCGQKDPGEQYLYKIKQLCIVRYNYGTLRFNEDSRTHTPNLFSEFLAALHVPPGRLPPLAFSVPVSFLPFQPQSVLCVMASKDSSLQTSPEIIQYSSVLKKYFILLFFFLVMGAFL